MLHPEVNKSPLGYIQLLQGWKEERVCYERGGWHSTKQCDVESCWSPLSQPTAGVTPALIFCLSSPIQSLIKFSLELVFSSSSFLMSNQVTAVAES